MARRFSLLIGLAVLALTVRPAAAYAFGDPINSYSVIDIGSLGGGAASAYGVNDGSQVVGLSYDKNQLPRAFLWQNGVMSDLGTLGGSESAAYGINNLGQVAGFAATPAAIRHAFLWQNGEMSDLGTLGGGFSEAYGINDSGHVVGGAQLANGQIHAFLWREGTMHDLGTLPGCTFSIARGINASGQVVGFAGDAAGNRWAFIWTPYVPNGPGGTLSVLHPTSGNQAFGVNNAGEVAGDSIVEDDGYWRALIWDASGPHFLGALFPWYPSVAYGISSTAVVGYAIEGWDEYAAYSRGFVWDPSHGMRDLNVLSGYATGTTLDNAQAISESGLIAANAGGYVGGVYKAYLLTPSAVPVRPLGLAARGGDAQVALSWLACEGATGYRVRRSTGGGPYESIASDLTTPAYIDQAVINGTFYSYVVSAMNEYGESSDSDPAGALPVPVPAPPTGLVATAGDQLVNLSWNASTWAGSYGVYRSYAPGGPYDFAGSTSQTTYQDIGWYEYDWEGYPYLVPLQNGVTYYYVVIAANSTGSSPDSNEASATPAPPPAPPAPTGLSATPGTRLVNLSWNASAGPVTHYSVKRAVTSGGPYVVVATTGATAWQGTGLTSGQTHYYVVCAVNSGGASPDSSEVSATPTGPLPPRAPTSLTAERGRRRVTLTWNKSGNRAAVRYRIYRGTSNGGPYALISNNRARAEYSDTSVSRGTRYYYRVTAVDRYGQESLYSNQAAATPL